MSTWSECICNTSPLQYLHQLGLLELLPRLINRIVIPSAVEKEVLTGIGLGVDLPDLNSSDWIEIRAPIHVAKISRMSDL